MRNSLVAALVACANRPKKLKARRFLLGLSSDELQFIAEYLGSCILESQALQEGPSADLFYASPRLSERSADRALKIILVREYLCCAGVQDLPVRERTDHAVN